MNADSIRGALEGRNQPGGVGPGGPFLVKGVDHGTRIWVASGTQELARRVGDGLAVAVNGVCRARRWCHLALPGGRFVKAIYDEFRLRQVPWGDVEFYFTDEVGEPVHHPASSYGVAHDRLFQDPRIGVHQIHRIEGEHRELGVVAEVYEEELPGSFDVVLALLGARGEIGVIEAGSELVDGGGRRYLETVVERRPVRRVGCTGGEFESCESLIVVAEGEAKAEAVGRVLLGREGARELPGVLGLGVDWYLDVDAAAGLAGRLEPLDGDGR